MAIKHTFSSPKADGADATLVRPSDWNASHDDGGLQVNVDAISNVASNAVSIANAASNAASIVSQAVSVVSAFVDQVHLADADATTQPWETLLAGTNITLTEVADGHAILIDAAAGAGSVTSTELSAVSAQAASAINVVNNALSVLSQATSVADAALSARVDVVSSLVGAGADLEDAVDINHIWEHVIAGDNITITTSDESQAIVLAVPALDIVLNAVSIVSQALSVLSQATSVADAALSVRIDTQSQAISVLSQGHSVLSQAVSVADAALSVRIDTVFQGLSVVSNAASNALSVGTQGLLVALSALNSVSIVSQALSVEIADRISADSMIDADNTHQPWDFLLAGTNITFTEVADGHALIIDAAAGAGSVTSNEVSIVSAQAASAINVVGNAVSIVSQALSVETAARIAAIDTVSNAASIVSNALSALEVRVSTLSATPPGAASVTSAELMMETLIDASETEKPWDHIIAGDNITIVERGDAEGGAIEISVPGPITKVVTDAQGISVTGQTNISGLSASVSAGGIYRMDAMVMVNRGAGAAVAKMGLTFPAMLQARGYVRYTLSSPNGIPTGTTEVVSSQGFFAPFDGDSASGSIIISAANTAGLIVSNLAVYQGLFVVSTTGVIQLQAGASTSAGTGITILAGSYMQVFRIA